MKAKLNGIVNTAAVMIFIKGTPQEPKCKFSKALIRFLMDQNVTKFGYYDILSDANVREALKVHSNWKTYPQLYVSGKLIGGLDVVKELHADSAFIPQVPASALGKGLFPRLRALVDTKPTMLFIEGSQGAPETKEGTLAVKALRDMSIDFGCFDVRSDASIMNGLKQYGHVLTYPQLWVKSDVVPDFLAILSGTGKRTLAEVFAPPAPAVPAKAASVTAST
jgi:Grx4 family monothiol glutaredoxin